MRHQTSSKKHYPFARTLRTTSIQYDLRAAILWARAVILASITIFSTQPSLAYTASTNGATGKVRWAPTQKFNLAGNPLGNHSVSHNFFWNSVVDALLQWSQSTDQRLQFDYWQGTDSSVYETEFSQNGLSKIFFASRSRIRPDPSIIGYTQTTFNSLDGTMYQAETYLNDINYHFTENKSDTSSRSSFESRPRVYLPNVITHELGHSIGLSHSSHINSSMLFVEFSEQNLIACDDISGAREIYETPGKSSISGRIIFNRSPVAGAQITAVSLQKGIPVATTFTDSTGNYILLGLDANEVVLLVEPYDGPASSFPTKFQSRTNQTPCAGAKFPRQFVGQNSNKAISYSLLPGSSVTVPSYSIQCNLSQVQENTVLGNGAYLFQVVSGETKTFKFDPKGSFEAIALGYLISSPIKARMSVRNLNGTLLPVNTVSPIYESDSGFQIQDLAVSGSSQNQIQLRVQGELINTDQYPGPNSWPTGSSQILLLLNKGQGRSPASNNDADTRCAIRVDANTYQSPPGEPLRNIQGASSRELIGFCGSSNNINHRRNPDANNHDGPDAGAYFGWFLPFIIIALFSIRARIYSWVGI